MTKFTIYGFQRDGDIPALPAQTVGVLSIYTEEEIND